jgi:alkylation response protein AidB-like acyl-CoA dehydrogenase
MLFHPDADQRALIADAFSRPLDDLLPLARLHKADAQEPWAALAELGLFGIAAEEEIGGVGLSAAEEALLAIDLGRHLAGPQIFATMMALHLAADDLRPRIAAGECRVAPAILSGGKVCVIDGAGADMLLLRRDGEAVLIGPEAIADRIALHDHHWTATLETATIDADALTWAGGTALLRVRLIEAAALCGAAACASEMAVEYAGFRQQFGHPIGGFQAVKHHCANMAMAAMAARDLTTFAAVALDQERADATLQIESALLLAIDAALSNSRKNVQVHGGIGFSDEADPHLVVKRAHLLVEASGGSDVAAERVARAEAPLVAQG